ncbi:MAG: phosphotransferase [Verrucomicrobia bacterium]|nr:phosphotransferase [Verrucomicrobiota bacterium]
MIDIEDFAQLQGYLRDTGRIGSREAVSIRLLAGGVSNKTLLVVRSSGESWVIKQALRKLRVQSDWFSDPARIQVEANGLRYLPRVTPEGSTTALLFEDRAENLVAMEAVPEPHQNWKQQLLSGDISREFVGQFAKLLGTIHRESFRLRPQLAPVFADKQYFYALRLEPYYKYSATVAPEAAPFLEELVAWTLSRFDTLVHGDFSPKNVLLHNNRLVLLDHEVLHFGDPAFDVGFSLTHFLAKALHLQPKRQEFVKAALHYWKLYVDDVRGMPWTASLDFRAAQHTLASLLARACGRSPLEYLNKGERAVQQKIVVEMMMEENFPTVDQVITRFSKRIAGRKLDKL